ncbi:MAG: alanyl-tRNA editing protein [Formivibrio sp.]|nr:alanyl-tRNA editing protein [Formivibrio sp.]
MTEKIFWSDPYLSALDTLVTAVDSDTIQLKETIFYAFSGGQESDSGTIGGYPVQTATKVGTDIHYRLAPDHPLRTGDAVHVEIDWPRRYALMRLHFAAELVLELVSREVTAIEKVGAHIAQDKARIDFKTTENISAYFPIVSAKAQAIIEADLPIISAFSDEAAQRRYWEIPDFARVPCGGTHLRSTREVGGIRLKRKNVGKGTERIEIYLAECSPS